jgi:hypothetical protein
MQIIACLTLCLSLLSGCVTANSYLFRDKPDLISPARKLAEAYLEGQKNGETYRESSQKYGRGVSEFYGLKEYRYVYAGYIFSTPMLRYRIQATNQMGGIVWKNYDIGFSYDEKIASQDLNGGLRIIQITEAMFE